MKTLSIKQPWVELILQGKKKIEIRKWNTHFRGEFLIHSSKKPDEESMKKFGFKDLPNGFILGKVELIDVKNYKDDEEFLKDKNLHLAGKEWGNKGFVLKNPKRIKKVKHNGNLNFWKYNGEITIDNLIKLAESKKEIEDIFQYINDLDLDYPNYKEWIQECKRELEIGYKKAFYSEKDLEINGVIIFQPHKKNKNILEIKTFWVSPQSRKQGIGLSLFNLIEEYATKNKFKIIQIDTHNNELINFLLKRNLEIVGKENLYSPPQEETILQKIIK